MTADYIYPVPFVLGWLLALLAYLDTGRRPQLFAATLCLGFGVYTYIASVIMMPVYLLITLAVLVAGRRDPFREAGVAIAGFVVPLLLVPLWLAFHPQVVSETLARYGQTAPVPVGELTRGLSLDDALRELRRPVHFSGVLRRISLYWYFFDPAYLFVTGGYANPINSTRHVGVFLWPLFVLVPVGLWRIATKPNSLGQRLLVVGFLTAPVAAIFVPEPYAVDREAALMAFGALVAAAGLEALAAIAQPRLRLAVGALLVLVPLQFAGFLFDYFTAYRGQAAFWFGFNHRGAVEEVIARADDRVPAIYLTTAHDPVIDAYWRFGVIKYHREDLLSRTRHYDPQTLDPSTIPQGSLLIALTDERAMVRRVADGELRRILDVPEIADPPKFAVLQR